ncbi:hypothetical protein BDM02DRAFT_3153048 [Thelephora ganbajun]|uniref:Uncharacterized protein n=1 Tax=Thelephora ganbajun TaxID=370292 RepID=A0ACB6ZVJ5_THEGA|nr:hypothetical protein BDM02DRAFT_3153048 [Thelephora ganbajun]
MDLLNQARYLKALRDGTVLVLSPTMRAVQAAHALHLAVKCGSCDIIAVLLANRFISPNATYPPESGTTPLHLAASEGRDDVVNLLLDQEGIDDSLLDANGKSCKDVAKGKDVVKAIKDSRSFLDASYRSLLRSYILSPSLTTYNSPNPNPQYSSKPLIDLLSSPRIKHADLNYIDGQSGTTLLHEAAKRRDLSLLELAIRAGADVFVRDRKGRPVYDASGTGKDDQVRVFLRQFTSHDTTLLASSSSTAPPPTLKGYLHKYTNVARGYNTRWFVLKDGVLSYYRHQEDENIASRGSITMKSAILKVTSGTNEQRFEVHHIPSRGHQTVQKWYLKADHPVEGTRWTTMIRKNIDWYKQKEQRDREVRMSESSLRAPSMRSIGTANTSSNTLSSRHTKSTLSKGREQLGNLSDDGNGGPGSETSSITGVDGDSPAVPPPKIAVGLEQQEDGDDAPDDSSADDLAESDDPPFEDKFKIQENYVQIQTKLVSDYLHVLLQTRSPAIDLLDKVAQLKDNIGNINSTLGEYLGMVQKREAWWAAKLRAEQKRQDVWETSLKTVVEEGEALERELKSRSSRRRSRMFSPEHEEWRQNTLKAKPASNPPSRMGTLSPPHLTAGEVFTLSPEPIPSIETTPQSKELTTTTDLITESPTTTTTHAASTFLTASEISTIDEPVSTTTITAFSLSLPSANTVRRFPLAGSSKTPALLRGSPAADEIDTDEEDEEIDVFFDAIDAGTLPTIMSSMLQAYEEKFLELGKVQYTGYIKVRQKLDLDADNRPPTSLWSILKNSIGKDLTKISFPVFFNEPTSMLQRMAEDMEFPQCLDAAVNERDPLMRIAYVAAFAMSNYSSTFGRIAKPFNPMLGETFEYVDLKQQYRYVSEQVSHHPPISACWAESLSWRYYGEVDAQNKFMGKSFEIRPTGVAHAELILNEDWAPDYPKDKHPRNVSKVVEHYSWKKVITNISGFMLGAPTIDHYGEMIVTNHRTKDQCRLTFKPRGWRGKDAYEVSGFVVSGAGKQAYKVAGKWTKQLIACPIGSGEDFLHPDMDISTGQSTQNILLWKNSEKPVAPFNLTPFAITLNDCPEDTLEPFICPTDCRLRPDQRAFELGKYERANELKLKQEEKQRATRKAREEGRIPPHRPRWFMAETEPDTRERYWAPSKVGEELEYWLERERVWKARTYGSPDATWKNVEEIFIDDEP